MSMVSEYHYYGNNWSCLTTHRAIQLAIGHLNPMIASGVATSTGQDDSDQHSAVEHGARGILARLRAYEWGDWCCQVHCSISLSRGRMIHDLTLRHGKHFSRHKHVIFFPHHG